LPALLGETVEAHGKKDEKNRYKNTSSGGCKPPIVRLNKAEKTAFFRGIEGNIYTLSVSYAKRIFLNIHFRQLH